MRQRFLRHARRDLGLPDLDLVLREEWSSHFESGRREIRRFLHDTLDGEDSALDLETTPRFRAHSVSISHHQGLGGFALTPGQVGLGFDIELRARVRPDLVKRVCVSPSELSSAPDVSGLWTAKEAAYKALLGPLQPPGLADIEIGNWELIEEGLYRCELLKPGSTEDRRYRGLVTLDGDQSLALFSEVPCVGG